MRLRDGWLIAIAVLASLAAPRRVLAVDYTTEVKPILAKHCYSCHGSLRQKSGLRLDHVKFVREGGDRGAAIASTSAESLLISAVSGAGDVERMPLDAKPLSDAEIATLKTWIDSGAPAPEEPVPPDPRQHWSYQKPQRPALPDVKNVEWSAHPLDRFLAAEHERQGLTPAPSAAKNVLLRRVYLDLVGLPPTPADVAAFENDTSPDAYAHVVDRLLASPRYGERWARHWMDVWRYSDWDGYAAEVRESQPHIWRWRDWIIRSLNRDKPYDEMVRDMLAGDELAPGDPETLAATGFLVRNWYKFNRNVWLENTVEHTSKAFLGITLNCARCHDHMYDPILQTEYYQFRALFEPHEVRTDRLPGQSDTKVDGVVRAFDAKTDAATYLFARGNEGKPDKEHPLSPAVPRVLGGELAVSPVALRTTEYYPGSQEFVRQESMTSATAELERAQTTMTKAAAALAEVREKAKADEKLRSAVEEAAGAVTVAELDLLAAHAALAATRAKIAADQAAFAAPSAPDQKQLAIEAARAERVASSEQARRDVGRLERELTLAKAVDDEAAKKKIAEIEKKLAAARKTHEDAQAALAKNDENYTRFSGVYPATSTGRRAALARWITSHENPLAARVAVNHIWLRHFGSPLGPSVFDFGLNGKPPTHPQLLDWLACELMDSGWRMKAIHRLLVTSRAYQMQSSGSDASNLERDPENRLLWRMNPRRMEAEVVRDSTLAVAGSLDETMFGPDLDQNTGLTVLRRSIYFRSSKEKKVTFLEMFDSPNVTDCYRRSETVVPQQALAMVNSSLSLAQARRLAAALAGEHQTGSDSESLKKFTEAAFARILCRPPNDEELSTCLEFLTTQSQRLANPTALAAFVSTDANPVKPATDPLARARENLVHVLLNHNDFVTVR